MKSKILLKLSPIALMLIPCAAFASRTGINSWEKTLYNLSSSLNGPVAYSISLIAIVVCGLAMAFTDLQGGAKRFIQAACGLSIAFFSMQIVTNFIGFSGAVV